MPLAACAVDDLAFEARLPPELRQPSQSHFTPVDVARRVAMLLAPEAGKMVLDVGAGAGKFCLVAAHTQRTAHFVGVEVRPHLVALATRLASEWRLANTRFVCADAFTLDWLDFDGFYFFNPFAEQLLPSNVKIDDTLEHDPEKYERHIEITLDRLARARPGTRVVTYHGLGADLPPSYALANLDKVGSDHVELWIQTRAQTTRRYRRVEVPE